MNDIELLAIELVIGLILSGITIAVLYKPLTELLIDICGTEIRAKFWVTYSNIMLVFAPLLSEMMFGKSGHLSQASFLFFKTAFGCALFGIFASLVIIGMQINRSIPKAGKGN